ncbi:NEW3 domain-containing protein [Chloroflexota bacterium]
MNVKVQWFLLLLAVLVITLSPAYVLAQGERQGLYLRLSSGSYYNEVVSGEDNTFYLEVVNDSTKTITDIQFHADGPDDWIVEFRPQNLASISAGDYQTIDANIRPPVSASRGNYNITFIAESAGTRAVMSLSVRVEQGTSAWMLTGIIIAAVVIAGFVIVFMRLGRQ